MLLTQNYQSHLTVWPLSTQRIAGIGNEVI